ncbi:peptidoglycan glycosyltransferase [Marinilongibacter aquaticus]|uniref:penicillin-binding transpeptidase domain-containing protein n=1 Tax=Marinilongibacter aquaticus TaxID=2975157 RepID=UPI0021BDD644|nr:penicillin-binding transpeptidase domain-containing protein [Marinilongibacter aquaticus]UBM60468.1 peptidoglycan glycosyltransferase [Marinilongibacter aquaticus]
MLESRKQVILFFFFTIGIIYLSRLFYIQIVDPKYRSIEATNAIKRQIEVPLRGQIYDRNHKLLVQNREVYNMYVTPREVTKLDTNMFCKVFRISRGYFDSTMHEAIDYSRNRASLFLRQLSKEEFARVADVMVNFKGFSFEQSFFRTYPAHTLANALGYIGEIPKKQYDNQEQMYYRKGDYIGLSGIEREYEEELRGIRGVKFTLMDVHGADKGSYEHGNFDTTAVVGQDLYSSIDIQLQQLADSLFQNKVGAVVAIEPKTGEILAMGSYPTYDPNLLSGKAFSKNYLELVKDPDKPTFNRAISSFYRPGSTFKLIQALIGQQQGVINLHTSFIGAYSPMGCHGHGMHHMANLNNAVQFSCNPYFYNVFKKIIENTSERNPFIGAREGLTRWHDMVEKFGFGTKLGIDLPGEKSQLLPNLSLYDKYYGEDRWKFSNIYSLSIGEGELGLDVLKLANMAASIANKGYWITPHLIRGVGEDRKNMKSERVEVHQTGVNPQYFENIYDGMQKVIEAGTARQAYIPDIAILGKTGTSQNKRGRDHAIFVAFAPRENPKIAIAAVVENAGFGGSSSGPIASLMIEKYLKGKIERRALAERMMNTSYKTVAAQKAAAK